MDINGNGCPSATQVNQNEDGVAVDYAGGYHFILQNHDLLPQRTQHPHQGQFTVPAHLQHLPNDENTVGYGQSNDYAETQITTEDNHVQPKSKKQAKGKKVARRGSGFSKEEDKTIISAFLNISKDPVTGVNQSSGGYYKRIHEYYKEHKAEGSDRSQIAIQHRWAAIQKAVNKFCGLKSIVDRRNESGKSEQNKIDDAVAMYEAKEPFTYLHCWRLLKDEAKWSDRMVELNTAAAKPQQLADEPLDNNGEPARPEGRDTAKRRKAKVEPDTFASSTAFEVLQQMNNRCEESGLQQHEQMQKMLGMKENKIALEEKMYDLHKQDVERRAAQKEEQLKLTKLDIEARDKQSEAQLINAEIGIMGADLEKLAPTVKAYYIAMQADILMRRGISPP